MSVFVCISKVTGETVFIDSSEDKIKCVGVKQWKRKVNPPVKVTSWQFCCVLYLHVCVPLVFWAPGHFHDYQHNCLSSLFLWYNTLFNNMNFRIMQHLLFLSIRVLRVTVNLFLVCVDYIIAEWRLKQCTTTFYGTIYFGESVWLHTLCKQEIHCQNKLFNI